MATKREHFIGRIYNALQDVIREPDLSPDQIRWYAREISNHLFEISTCYSGKTSEAALILRYNEGVRECNEHLWPRQAAAEGLIAQIYRTKELVMRDLIKDINDMVTVNRTTSAENTALRPYQKSWAWTSPEEAYAKVGIVLLNWENSTRISRLPELHPHLIIHLKEKELPHREC